MTISPGTPDPTHSWPGVFTLNVVKGATSATAQLADQLKALIVAEELPPGTRMPTERELIEKSGVSRITVRAAMQRLETEGWVIRKQGLGTFVSDSVDQELTGGVRTITEVLVDQGLNPLVDVLGHSVHAPTNSIARVLGPGDVLEIRRRYRDGEHPVAIVTIYLPAETLQAAQPLLTNDAPLETTYLMWEQRLGTRIKEARHHIHAAGAPDDIAEGLGLKPGSPVLVLERTSYSQDGRALEVVIFHYRPERYGFSVVLPRTISGPPTGITERNTRP